VVPIRKLCVSSAIVNVALRSSPGLPTTNLTLFSGLLQLPISLGMDRLRHRLPQISVDEVTATAIENAAQAVERPADVDVRSIDVPVLMPRHRLLKASPFFESLPFHFDNIPALTRHSLVGLTAAMSASSIMNLSRRYTIRPRVTSSFRFDPILSAGSECTPGVATHGCGESYRSVAR
jgi:hypothetical protein